MTSWQKAIKYAAMVFAILLVVSIVGGRYHKLNFAAIRRV